MVRVTVRIEQDGMIIGNDWSEFTDHDYAVFERRLWGWGTSNFIVHLVDKMFTGMGMLKLTPQKYADKVRLEIEHP